MKKLLLKGPASILFLIAVFSTNAFAQTDSTIYGIARKTSPPSVFLAKINPTTGVVSNISSTSLGTGVLVPGATIDFHKNIFYFTDNNSKFIGVSLTTGNMVTSATMTNANTPYFGQFFYNCKDSVIYGLSRKTSPQSVFLAKINPTTGVISNISSSLAVTAQIPAGTLDPINKIFYFVDEGYYFKGVNLATGNIVSNAPITHTYTPYFDQFFFNCLDTTIYGLARRNSPNSVFLAKINPSTGVVTHISSTNLATIAITPAAGIDPINKIFYFENSITNIIGVSLTTGSIVTSPAMTNANAQYFDQFVYNKCCCTNNLPLSLSETNIDDSPLRVYPNPSSENITVEIKNYGNYSVELLNELGQKIFSKTITNERKFDIEAPGLSKGIYYLKVFDGNKLFISKVELGL